MPFLCACFIQLAFCLKTKRGSIAVRGHASYAEGLRFEPDSMH